MGEPTLDLGKELLGERLGPTDDDDSDVGVLGDSPGDVITSEGCRLGVFRRGVDNDKIRLTGFVSLGRVALPWGVTLQEVDPL